MGENDKSATVECYPNLNDMVVEAAVWRIERGLPFDDNEMDLLLHLSSEDTQRIVDRLDDDELLRFNGLLWARQEAIAARFQEACRDGG